MGAPRRSLRRSPAPLVPVALAVLLAVPALTGCKGIVDDRIPSLPVTINLSDPGMWNTYGVSGFGIYRYFILGYGLREPAGFPYTQATYTGFGGVLLIGGMNPLTTETNVPLAYDLACPVERDPQVRVFIDIESFEAVCPQCGSHYDVTMAGGAPTSGPAIEGARPYGLRRYNCLRSSMGGYVIRD